MSYHVYMNYRYYICVLKLNYHYFTSFFVGRFWWHCYTRLQLQTDTNGVKNNCTRLQDHHHNQMFALFLSGMVVARQRRPRMAFLLKNCRVVSGGTLLFHQVGQIWSE